MNDMSTTDQRMIPANGHAAAFELKGQVEAARFVKGTVKSVKQPLLNLMDEPRGKRASQLLFGERSTLTFMPLRSSNFVTLLNDLPRTNSVKGSG